MHLSYSKIKTYLSCPLKFKFTYIDRIPQKPKPYFKFSRVIHYTLHIYHFYQKYGSLDGLLRCYDESWKASNLKSDRLYEEGKSILINFFHEFGKVAPYRGEEKFKVNLGPHILSGKIDRVDRENGRFKIIDYKMGKNISEKEDFILQLKIYSVGFYKLARIVPAQASFYFLRYSKKLSIVPTKDGMDETIKLIYLVAGKIRRGNFLPSKGKACRMCDYKDRCFSERKEDLPKEAKRLNQLIFNF